MTSRDQHRYFRKDYAPARIMAERQRANSPSGKFAQNLKRRASTAAQSLSASLSRRSSRRPAAKPTASRRTTTPRREPFTWREASLLSMIGVSALCIAAAFVCNSLFDPVKRSERELDKIAHDYYIEYLYPHALGKYLDQPEVVLADYVQQGLPNVRLRQLLLYDNGKYADSISIFSNSAYECDTNKSYVRYYPVEPYGPRDVEIQYGTSCTLASRL